MGFRRFERKRILVAALFLALSMEGAMAYSSYRNKIPNGQTTIDGAVGYGHVSKSGGGPRNQFGLDFAGKARTWSKSLCCLDSDGDGKHNGLELGDPCCTWTQGGTPDVTSGLSHPGRDDSTTTNTIPSTCTNVCTASPTPTPAPTPASTPAPTPAPVGPAPSDTKEMVSKDGKWKATWAISGEDITFTVTNEGSGWFALGVSKDGSMSSGGDGSDIVVCEVGASTAKRYFVTSYSTPTGGTSIPSSTCSISNSKGKMTFTRKLVAASNQRAIAENGETSFLYASANAGTLQGGVHNVKGSLSVDVASGKASAAAKISVPALLALHAVLMLLSWGFLLPMGITIANRCRKVSATVDGKPAWFGLHQRLQYAGWFLQILGAAAIIVQKSIKSEAHFSSGMTANSVHMWMGLVVVILGTLQPLNAFFRPHPKNDAGKKTQGRKVWEAVHKNSGWLAGVAGFSNCWLAVAMLFAEDKYQVWLAIVSVCIIGIVTIMALFAATPAGSKSCVKYAENTWPTRIPSVDLIKTNIGTDGPA